jgi:hypothetical protein
MGDRRVSSSHENLYTCVMQNKHFVYDFDGCPGSLCPEVKLPGPTYLEPRHVGRISSIFTQPSSASLHHTLHFTLLSVLGGDVIFQCIVLSPIPVAARSKAWVCSRSGAGIAGSNLIGGHGCLSLVSVVYCQVEVPAPG